MKNMPGIMQQETMDHPYLSKQRDIESAKARIEVLRDITLLNARMSADMHAKMSLRREQEISDEVVRNVLLTRAKGLGMLMETVGLPEYSKAWEQFMTNHEPFDEKMLQTISDTERQLNDAIQVWNKTEDASEVSSCSDYSDLDTQSDDSEEEGEEEGDEEDESQEASDD